MNLLKDAQLSETVCSGVIQLKTNLQKLFVNRVRMSLLAANARKEKPSAKQYRCLYVLHNLARNLLNAFSNAPHYYLFSEYRVEIVFKKTPRLRKTAKVIHQRQRLIAVRIGPRGACRDTPNFAQDLHVALRHQLKENRQTQLLRLRRRLVPELWGETTKVSSAN